jgi:Mlc titration factor MtfA (ptsG expression regulator)
MMSAPDLAPVAAWDETWWGPVAVLAGILAVLLLIAWSIRHSERATGLLGRLAGLAPLGPWQRGRHRQAEAAVPFPAAWVALLRQNVGLYGLLTQAEQECLHRLIVEFLAGRNWEGCRGQPIDDEVRVTVAGQACLLLLGRPDDDFDQVPSVLVYPTGFRTDYHAVVEGQVATLGQAVYRGPVVLAWDEVVAGARDPAGGRNVVLHEFAHQLDFAGDAPTTDAAELARRRRRQEVFASEYARLVDDANHGRATLLDPYGATSPAEFFAVATECFFGRPAEMRARHPELYQVLHEFYGQDTAARFEAHRDGVSRPAFNRPPHSG